MELELQKSTLAQLPAREQSQIETRGAIGILHLLQTSPRDARLG
jgi:hypothetical protein